MSYSSCIDCGTEKTLRQQDRARCRSCACSLPRAGGRGKSKSIQTRQAMSLSHGGDGDILNRKYPGLTIWARLVKERDGHKCAECGYQGIPGKRDVDAHHVIPKATHPELATVLFNGVTLCKPCHKEIHFGTHRTGPHSFHQGFPPVSHRLLGRTTFTDAQVSERLYDTFLQRWRIN